MPLPDSYREWMSADEVRAYEYVCRGTEAWLTSEHRVAAYWEGYSARQRNSYENQLIAYIGRCAQRMRDREEDDECTCPVPPLGEGHCIIHCPDCIRDRVRVDRDEFIGAEEDIWRRYCGNGPDLAPMDTVAPGTMPATGPEGFAVTPPGRGKDPDRLDRIQCPPGCPCRAPRNYTEADVPEWPETPQQREIPSRMDGELDPSGVLFREVYPRGMVEPVAPLLNDEVDIRTDSENPPAGAVAEIPGVGAFFRSQHEYSYILQFYDGSRPNQVWLPHEVEGAEAVVWLTPTSEEEEENFPVEVPQIEYTSADVDWDNVAYSVVSSMLWENGQGQTDTEMIANWISSRAPTSLQDAPVLAEGTDEVSLNEPAVDVLQDDNV